MPWSLTHPRWLLIRSSITCARSFETERLGARDSSPTVSACVLDARAMGYLRRTSNAPVVLVVLGAAEAAGEERKRSRQ